MQSFYSSRISMIDIIMTLNQINHVIFKCKQKWARYLKNIVPISGEEVKF